MQQACLQNLYSRLVDDSTENYFVMLLTYLLEYLPFYGTTMNNKWKRESCSDIEMPCIAEWPLNHHFTNSEKMNSLFNYFLWQ